MIGLDEPLDVSYKVIKKELSVKLTQNGKWDRDHLGAVVFEPKGYFE